MFLGSTVKAYTVLVLQYRHQCSIFLHTGISIFDVDYTVYYGLALLASNHCLLILLSVVKCAAVRCKESILCSIYLR